MTAANLELVESIPDTSIGETLSPTQATSYLDCGYKWYCRSVLKLPDPKTAGLSIGSAVHDAIGANYALKVDTGEDLPIEDVLTEFEAAWATVEQKTEFREDESPADLAQMGRNLVTLYMREVAPKIQPLAVELPVEGVIGGVHVRGVIDLIDQDYCVHDTKTAAKKPSKIPSNHLFQLTTYAQLSPRPMMNVRYDVLAKTKTPSLVQLSQTLTDADFRYTQELYPLVQESMRTGLAIPNRQSVMCSRKYCGFWRSCEMNFGGTVPGGQE